jgi:hypothetical protein
MINEGIGDWTARLKGWAVSTALPWVINNKKQIAVAGSIAGALAAAFGVSGDYAQQIVDMVMQSGDPQLADLAQYADTAISGAQQVAAPIAQVGDVQTATQ